jgi:hypothetical protein
MPLSWNEIRSRAVEFFKEWENETRENAEAKSFWDGFFKVFGIKRRKIGIFEAVKLMGVGLNLHFFEFRFPRLAFYKSLEFQV